MRATWAIPLLLVASLSSFMPSASAASVDVVVGHDDTEASVSYLKFYPSTVVIMEGDTVNWKIGAEETPHTVSAPPAFDSSPAIKFEDFVYLTEEGGALLPGASFNHTFTEAGTFAYHCKFHSHMTGVIHVVEPVIPRAPGSSPPEVHIDTGWGGGQTSVDRYGPSEITIEVGTTVIWTNTHPNEWHTVTADVEEEAAEPEYDSSPAFEFAELPDWFAGPEGVLLQAGPHGEFSHTFTEAGTYEYFCKLHPEMKATVIVLPRMDVPDVDAAIAAHEAEHGETTAASPGVGALAALLVAGLAAVVMRRRRGT